MEEPIEVGQIEMPADSEIIAGEIEMLDGLIAEMTAKVGEASAALRKMVIVREALQKQMGEIQMDLPIES
jgi:hypothetical protein